MTQALSITADSSITAADDSRRIGRENGCWVQPNDGACGLVHKGEFTQWSAMGQRDSMTEQVVFVPAYSGASVADETRITR